jgi:hypothetical protein
MKEAIELLEQVVNSEGLYSLVAPARGSKMEHSTFCLNCQKLRFDPSKVIEGDLFGY